MKSKSKILLVALVFSAYFCSYQGVGLVTIVDMKGSKMAYFNLNELSTDIATIPLSSLVEDCMLVQLESIGSAYVGHGDITVTKKFIGISQFDAPYKLFDLSGKFLRNIGAIGRGPGEWSVGEPYDAIIDDKNELIYFSLFMSDKILVYSTSGQFMKELVTPHKIQKPKMFLTDDILTVAHIPLPNDRAIAFQFDVNTGKILKELAPPAHLVIPDLRSELISSRNVQGVFDLHYTSVDTLYHFDLKNNRLLPAISMSYFSNERVMKRYSQLNQNMFLANVLTFVPNMGNRGVFRGDVPVATDITFKTSTRINVVNDFFGSISSPITAIRNGYFVFNIQPEELIEEIERRLAQSNCTESDRKILTKTLSNIEKGTNNVVFIGKLKSETKTKLW